MTWLPDEIAAVVVDPDQKAKPVCVSLTPDTLEAVDEMRERLKHKHPALATYRRYFVEAALKYFIRRLETL